MLSIPHPKRMRPIAPKSAEKKPPLPESIVEEPAPMTEFPIECWYDDTCILDMDYFIKTLSGIKAKGVRPDFIGSIITHYASRWLPDINGEETIIKCPIDIKGSPESITAIWMKKRFLVETLVGILPPEKDAVSCNFLLRLLRVANMVGAEQAYRAELEKRVAWQLDQASLKDLMIPSFNHMCANLFDFELVFRLVKMFVELDEAAKSGLAFVKVAKLVDRYLAEAAIDANLTLSEFIALGGALPSHARATDDGLYRAIDTYLKAHPKTSKQDRKTLCRLIDSRKLSPEATLHVAQNERLPVRAVIQVLAADHVKRNCNTDWSGSFRGIHSPTSLLDTPGWCQSKRDLTTVQQQEIRKLREEVLKLQSQCYKMEAQIDKVSEKKRGFFRWRNLGVHLFRPCPVAERMEEGNRESESGSEYRTPAQLKKKLVKAKKPSKKWRDSS